MSCEFSTKDLKIASPKGSKIWHKCEDTKLLRATWDENKLLIQVISRADVAFQADCCADGSGSTMYTSGEHSQAHATLLCLFRIRWFILGVCLPHNSLIIWLPMRLRKSTSWNMWLSSLFGNYSSHCTSMYVHSFLFGKKNLSALHYLQFRNNR